MKLSKPIVILSVGAAIAWGVALGALAGRTSPEAGAVRATDFNPGRIIDDAVFFDKDSMSVAEIQAFLEQKTPTCDTWGAKLVGSENWAYSGWTRAAYAAEMRAQGQDYFHAPPYICLTNYYEHPTTYKTSFETNGQRFEGSLSAAEIIYQVAQTYGISPKVLLVTLKKEYGALFVDEWPVINQFNYVMGAGCPDSGPGWSARCDPNYKGFYRQMDYAGWLFNRYRTNIASYNYQPGSWNWIQYNPNPACGYQHVYIENVATAMLYIYTPYVPNAGALASYPGTADCGAYGNRNFFMYYNEWFGTTFGQPVKVVNSTVPDEKYAFMPFDAQSDAIGYMGVVGSNGVVINPWKYGADDDQLINVVANDDDTYSLIDPKSGLMYDVSMGNNNKLQLWESNCGDNQKWILVKNTDGSYYVVSKMRNDLAFTLSDVDGGKRITLEPLWGIGTQKFYIVSRITPTTDIADGIYKISSKVNLNRVFDTKRKSKDNSIPVQVYDDMSGLHQMFAVQRNEDGTYKITAVHSDKVVDLSRSNVAQGAIIQQYADNETENQKWVLSVDEDGYVTIVTELNYGFGIALSNNNADNSSALQLARLNGANTQKFSLIKASEHDIMEGAKYRITPSKQRVNAVDIKRLGTANGTVVQSYQYLGGENQQFYLTRDSDGSYTIVDNNSGKPLDMSMGNNNKLQLWESNGGANQRWILAKHPDGTYSIVSRMNGRCFDIGSDGVLYLREDCSSTRFILEGV